MTLTKIRGLPTLSLKANSRTKPRFGAEGNVCLLLFLFILGLLQLVTTPLFAQDRNRTEYMHHFGKVIISPEPLPDKVYEAQKNKILVSVVFFEKGKASKVLFNAVGTGFVAEIPGAVITARHLLDEALATAEKTKEDKRRSDFKYDYSYMFMGTIITKATWTNFPLFLVAIGEKGTLKDMMVLRTDITTIEKSKMSGDIINPNPYEILTKTSKFADAELGERVYVTGFAPVAAEYLDKKDQQVPVYVDMLNYTFSAEVGAVITDMPANKAGVKTMYRLHDSAEPGFSGGKVVNANGQVIGMTIAMSISKNFVYAISSKDIKDFLKDNHLR